MNINFEKQEIMKAIQMNARVYNRKDENKTTVALMWEQDGEVKHQVVNFTEKDQTKYFTVGETDYVIRLEKTSKEKVNIRAMIADILSAKVEVSVYLSGQRINSTQESDQVIDPESKCAVLVLFGEIDFSGRKTAEVNLLRETLYLEENIAQERAKALAEKNKTQFVIPSMFGGKIIFSDLL